MGVEFTPNQANFNSSETTRIGSKSGVSNGHFETVLSYYGDEGALKPGTTYYYRAYVYMAGTLIPKQEKNIIFQTVRSLVAEYCMQDPSATDNLIVYVPKINPKC